ncbi:GL13254 [Drosophila persimilis]|uniref:GL13254 n=1 Tax=Drosophila persimilis TaxID=7234 RepID=B4H770_DROPE|nr:GL13254 [Drosophila persimilis]
MHCSRSLSAAGAVDNTTTTFYTAAAQTSASAAASASTTPTSNKTTTMATTGVTATTGQAATNAKDALPSEIRFSQISQNMDWFNNICRQCRLRFTSSASIDLKSAADTYNTIRSRDAAEEEDCWWKVPMFLLICGCVIILLLACSNLCEYLAWLMRNFKVPDLVSDVCDFEESNRCREPPVASVRAPLRKQEKKEKCCSCCG